ncbi:helix-turn-helix domain-containing protein [Shouchella patagoniensis]|uniref:helix-turn-helix domain-containing protein n=1 Tax=Shouchella patagoniensis TaxID=228576 RepID=UPI0009954842|nr:helix-turn-helix domain-containing protein [Shouchella patagoniensis]
MKLLFLSDDSNNEELVQPLCLVANQLQATLDCLPIAKDKQSCGGIECYDAVFVDIDMDSVHVSSSRNFITRINKDYPAICLIVMQNEFRASEVRAWFKAGVFDVLEKPLDETILYELMNEISSQQRDKAIVRQPGKAKAEWMKRGFVYDLIFGATKHAKEIWDRSKQCGLSNTPTTVLIASIDRYKTLIKQKSPKWAQSLQSECTKAIQVGLNEQGLTGIQAIVDKDKLAILLPCQYEDDIKHIARLLQYGIQQRTGYTVTVGIGNHYEDPRNLYASYKEAWQAQANKFYVGKNKVIHYTDIDNLYEKPTLVPYEKLDVVSQLLRRGELDQGKSELQQIRAFLFTNCRIEQDVLHLQVTDILNSLLRAALNNGCHPDMMQTVYSKFMDQLKETADIYDIEKWFVEMIENILFNIHRFNNEKMLRPIQQAVQYIEDTYNQPISLEEVADHVRLSANYFSNTFKKTMGLPFVKYLAKIRVERAKPLLHDLDYTVYQVASEVGYTDSRYFSRVFKSFEGKTPSEYRNARLVK